MACDIDLDRVPKKYEGLDGTELAISESQERMAVALAASDVDEFMGYATEENLEATVIATVTEEPARPHARGAATPSSTSPASSSPATAPRSTWTSTSWRRSAGSPSGQATPSPSA